MRGQLDPQFVGSEPTSFSAGGMTVEPVKAESTTMFEMIAALDAEIAANERDLEAFSIVEPSEIELRRLRAACAAWLGRFDDLLLGEVPLARQALRKRIPGRIEFHPEEHRGSRQYRLRWGLSVNPLIGEGYINVASPRGFEPLLPP